MGKYTMIADVGERLTQVLQRELVPEVIPNPNEIGLRSPAEHGDVSLGLFLYDVRLSEEISQPGLAVIRNERIQKIPVYLPLYYMVTAYSSGDVKYRLAQEERILGKVIQTFHDYPVIPLGEVDAEKISGIKYDISNLS